MQAGDSMARNSKRKLRKHKHFYILNKNNFGKCKCGATKQFPVEKKLALRPSEVLTFENLSRDSRVDPSSWLNAEIYEEKI
jgi:hypothetical protein